MDNNIKSIYTLASTLQVRLQLHDLKLVKDLIWLWATLFPESSASLPVAGQEKKLDTD